jgi:hypothetical protein
MVSQFSPDDAFCAVGLLDGQVSIIGNKNQNKNISYSMQARTPLTALTWTGERKLVLGNSEGNI